MNNDKLDILMIEDNPGDARLIKEMLSDCRNMTVELKHVETIAEGLRCLESSPAAAVLLDLSLPDSQGLESLHCIITRNPSVPVIVFTGLDNDDVGLQAVQAGAQDYLVKGMVDPDKLARSIKYSINRNKILLEKQELVKKLQAAVDNIKQLRGLLPICSRCHKIRNDKGYWETLELYISEHSNAEFTHSLCNECAAILYPEYFKPKKPKGK